MAINKQRKNALLEQYIDWLQKSSGLVITEYRGMSMSRFDTLRDKMREAGAKYAVTKNTILKIALKEVGFAVPEELLVGPVAVGFAFENLPGTVKALIDATKDNELLILKGAIANTEVFRADQLTTLSELPTLDQLRATLAGMLVQPMSQLISLMVAPQRDVVSVIAAYLDKHEAGDAA